MKKESEGLIDTWFELFDNLEVMELPRYLISLSKLATNQKNPSSEHDNLLSYSHPTILYRKLYKFMIHN